MKKILLLVILIGGTALYGYYHKRKLDTFLGTSAERILKKLPNVSMPVFNKGETVHLPQLAAENDYLVVHFWATWCGPCEQEFPDLVRLIKRLEGKKVKFVLVAVDDKKEKIQKFLKKFEKITQNYSLLVDDQKLHRKFFGISKLPESFIFDKNGRVVRTLSGPQDWLSAPFISYFDSLTVN